MGAELIGAHMPTSGGIGGSIRDGKAIGCTAVQVFTSSPRTWKSAPIDPKKVKDFQDALKETEISAVISHDSYLINLADPTDERKQKSIDGLSREINRCAQYGISFVVSHMGAHMGQGEDTGLSKVAEGALEILKNTPTEVTLLMETTAGQGSSLNYKFEHLAKILELTKNPDRLAVCLDTCHIFAAGYDIRTDDTYHETFQKFDKVVGMDKLKVIHCNDSKKALGSRVDRHENLGDGEIGARAFQLLVNDPRFEKVPIVVETPIENDGHRLNVQKLWNWINVAG